MAVQTFYGDIDDRPADAGGRIGILSSDVVRPLGAGGGVQKVSTITVDNAINATTYTYTFVGETISFLSGGAATLASVAAGLAAAHNANSTAASRGVAVPAAAVVTITAVETNDDFAISEADANLTLATPTAASAGTTIPFGIGVQVNGFEQVQIPGGGGAEFAGVALKTQLVEGTATGAAYAAEDVVEALEDGECWVELDAGQAPGIADAVFYRITAGAGEQLGAFRVDADGGDSLVLASCRWTRPVKTALDGSTLIAGLMVHKI